MTLLQWANDPLKANVKQEEIVTYEDCMAIF